MRNKGIQETYTVPPEISKILDEIKDHGFTIASFVRDAIDMQLAKETKKREVLQTKSFYKTYLEWVQ